MRFNSFCCSWVCRWLFSVFFRWIIHSSVFFVGFLYFFCGKNYFLELKIKLFFKCILLSQFYVGKCILIFSAVFLVNCLAIFRENFVVFKHSPTMTSVEIAAVTANMWNNDDASWKLKYHLIRAAGIVAGGVWLRDLIILRGFLRSLSCKYDGLFDFFLWCVFSYRRGSVFCGGRDGH